MGSSGHSARWCPKITNGDASFRPPPLGYAPVQRPHVNSIFNFGFWKEIDGLEIGKDFEDWICPIKLFENVQ